MSVLFIYDGMIKVLNNDYYTDIFDDALIQRYTFLDKEVQFIMRQSKLDEGEIDKYNRISYKNFKFIPINNPCTIKGMTIDYFKIRNIIREKIFNSKFIIIRLPSFSGNIAIRECNKIKKNYIIEMVACPWDVFWNHSIKGKLIAPFMFLTTRKKIKQSPNVIYVTNKFLQKCYPNNGLSIGCSDVELPMLNEKILEKRIHRISIIKNRPIILGTIAAVDVKYKGQEYVIKAISKLNSTGYNFEYYLVGGGNNTYLKAVAKKYYVDDKVRFTGSLSHEKVFKYLDNIDLYIQPSKVEGLPRALIEAMSRGCPSIGSDVGGIPELLNHKFVFNSGAVDEICELLKLMDKQTMIEEAKRNYNKAKNYEKKLLDIKRNMFYKQFIKQNN